MFALLEISRIFKALKFFADLQGPICYKDPQNQALAFHFRINYDLNLDTAEFLELGLCNFGETLFNARH